MFVGVVVTACSYKEVIPIEDLINIKSINKVEMHNNSGDFELSNEQIVEFREDLELLKHIPNESVKVGGIMMKIYGEKEQYIITGNTNGTYVEIDVVNVNSDFSDTYTFKCSGINFDNYKPE